MKYRNLLLQTTLATLALGSIIGCGGSTSSDVTPSETGPQGSISVADNAKAKSQLDQMVAAIEPNLKVGSDGTIVIEKTRSFTMTPTQLAFAETAVSKTNELVRAGVVTVSPTFELLPTTRANENGWQWRWYGGRLAMDANRTRYAASQLRDFGISAFIAASQIGDPRAATLIRAVSSPLRASAWLLDYFNRPNRGVFIYVMWFSPYVSIESQS